MSETQQAIVPREEALARLNEKVGELIALGEKIEVRDAETCLWAKQYSVSVKSYFKSVDLYADGDIQDAKERLSTLQAAKKMLLAPVVAVFEAVEKKRKEWEESERKAAEAEGAKPMIPTLQGVPSRRTYKAELMNFDAFLKEYVKVRGDRTNAGKARENYLRQFLAFDDKMLSAEARKVQDPDTLMKAIPGIRAWTE